MDFKRGNLYKIKDGKGRILWANGPEHDDFATFVPEGGIVLLIEVHEKKQNDQNWIRVVFQDQVGFLLHGFPDLSYLLEDVSLEQDES
jgi:hypothetical protein